MAAIASGDWATAKRNAQAAITAMAFTPNANSEQHGMTWDRASAYRMLAEIEKEIAAADVAANGIKQSQITWEGA